MSNVLPVKKNASRITNYIFLAMIWWALSACLSSPECLREDVFCAALVTDMKGIDDHGINQDAWAGMEAAQANGFTDKVDIIESVDPRDYSKNIAYFAERNYDIIFTSGIALEDETHQAADLYPYTVFVGLSQPFEESRPNLIPITFPEDQMGFAAGLLAAKISETGIVGAVCEASGIDAMWRYCEGFKAGAEYGSDTVDVFVHYREGGDSEKLFIDEAWGYETGASLVEQGADVIFAAGGGTGQGALRAASEAGVMSIGSERNQAAGLGEFGSGVVTSFYGAASFEVQETIRIMSEGQIPTARIGQIQFVPLGPLFPESLGTDLKFLLEALENGEIPIKIPLESR